MKRLSIFQPKETALVQYGYDHYRCRVRRDADDRPYVVIFSRAIRIDDPSEITNRKIIWLKRRRNSNEAGLSHGL